MSGNLADAIQNERVFIGSQFQEILQQLDLLCIDNTSLNTVLQKIVEQIPGLQDLLQQIADFNLQYINDSFFGMIDQLLQKSKAFRNDIYYFAALLHNLFRNDTELNRNGLILQQMVDNLIKSIQNIQQMNSKYGRQIAIQRSYSRAALKSPNSQKPASRQLDVSQQTPTLNQRGKEDIVPLDNSVLSSAVIKPLPQRQQIVPPRPSTAEEPAAMAKPAAQTQPDLSGTVLRAVVQSLPAELLVQMLSDEQKLVLKAKLK